ncbi:hypothetical protein XH94_32560 [Bradyrhizobium zhanjiangense]|uniref:Uncharacterized protein n=2 Tax=Bradyrhizobium zhanjiangense TaxID=1325107 RepID=A0A4V1L2L2_9BRAD|nr:hypothetical protein XH94_32560 [Bradyrhizobium zhanjiangense]
MPRRQTQNSAALAEDFDQRAIAFLRSAEEGLVRAYLAAASAKDADGAAAAFEAARYDGILQGVKLLPSYPIERSEFDALPLHQSEDEIARRDHLVGLYRWRAGGVCWVLVMGNSNGTAAFFQPEFTDGPAPLN